MTTRDPRPYSDKCVCGHGLIAHLDLNARPERVTSRRSTIKVAKCCVRCDCEQYRHAMERVAR